jgi:hypothetical protein
VNANFGESPKGEVPRIPIPRTSMNKGKSEGQGVVAPALRPHHGSMNALSTLLLFEVPHLPCDQPFARGLSLEKPRLRGLEGGLRTISVCCSGPIEMRNTVDPVLGDLKCVYGGGPDAPFGGVVVGLFALSNLVRTVLRL